jgi:K+-sensing histidine kinase KdpD
MTTDFDEPETKEELHEVISSVYHDLNNPLSIIAGNAQFLVELSQEEELDEQFLSSAQDIQEASQQMSESLQRLTRLKERLKKEAQ